MSRKNHNSRTSTASVIDDDRHLHSVADDPGQLNAPTTENKVHAALASKPDATTAKLAMAAGVGRSTAAKILARWDREGIAIRTAGDGPRNPDTWALAPSDNATTAPGTDDAQSDVTATPSTDLSPDHASDDDTTADAHAESDGTTPPPETAPMDPADSVTEAELSPAVPPVVTETTGTARRDKDRLPKGGLRALVEEYLTERPGESFGPAKIGTDLRRSGGAVNNALEKLVADGYAIKTCEAPKRFAISPDKTDVPETADGTE